MLCCHKYPHKYCVFLDSCERAYFRWMIAEHKDVLLKDVFASHTFLRPTPFFFFLFFFSDVWDLILQPHWPDWSLSETTCCFIQHNNQASNCLKYSLHFFFFDIPSQTNDVMPQHYSFFFFFLYQRSRKSVMQVLQGHTAVQHLPPHEAPPLAVNSIKVS